MPLRCPEGVNSYCYFWKNHLSTNAFHLLDLLQYYRTSSVKFAHTPSEKYANVLVEIT